MKKGIALLLTVMMVISLAACGSGDDDATAPPDVQLTQNGVSMTLPAGFKTMDTTAYGPQVAAAFSSEDGFIAIYVIRESREELGVDDSFTAKDYLQKMHDSLTGYDVAALGEKNGLSYFTYTEEVTSNGEPFTIKYLNIAYQNADDYYLLQFNCYEQEFNYFSESFFDWAKTITFS